MNEQEEKVEKLNVDVVMMNDDGNAFGKESEVVKDENVDLMKTVHVDFLD
jgi:hypothetical protein